MAKIVHKKKSPDNGRAFTVHMKEDDDMPTITIDTEENDDWMKSLPGYKNERKIHEQLAKKYSGKKVGNKLIVTKPKED